MKNNEVIVERSELPFPQHLSDFNSEFILGSLLCPYAIKLSCFQEHAWPKCNNVKKNCCCSKRQQDHPQGVLNCALSGGAQSFFPVHSGHIFITLVPRGHIWILHACRSAKHVRTWSGVSTMFSWFPKSSFFALTICPGVWQ